MSTILHVASECFPLAKTGGLGDVLGALPAAQRQLGLDARLALPAYGNLAQRLQALPLMRLELRGQHYEVLQAELAVDGVTVPLYLFHCPALFDRDGDPYRDHAGRDYGDNALRFGSFCEAVAQFLWQPLSPFEPDIVHVHDWQSGPLAAWLRSRSVRPRIVFTIHNLAYQGVFSRDIFNASGLPADLWHPDGVEYWGHYSFMKAGLTQADAITTVSPSYAQEIQRPEFGCGLDGLLRARSGVLTGIVNGIDEAVWSPQTDNLIAHRYDASTVAQGKLANRQALARRLGVNPERPLVGFVGRLASQKGVDLIIAAWPRLAELPASYVIVTSGDPLMEQQLGYMDEHSAPGKLAVCIAHSEPLAHQLTAAADLILMPSRYEPCGLNQLYAQRYGALPVVRRTGGLADTVVDASPQALEDGTATGVHFLDADANAVVYGVSRGLELLRQPEVTARMRARAMATDWTWTASARRYAELYRQLG